LFSAGRQKLSNSIEEENVKNNITLSQVSKKTGISVDKLRRWRRAGKIPAGWQAHPHAPVVYSLEDVEKIQAVL